MSDDERISEILGDYKERRDRGETITPEQVIREHPKLAEELKTHFEMFGILLAAFTEPPELPEGVPPQIGEYRLVREIGRGGMGVVYEAEQASMERRVALKVLSPSVTSAVQAVQRFQREAKAAGKLHHTNIVPVYGMGEEKGLWFYTMELGSGQSLGDVVSERKADREASANGAQSTGSTSLGREDFIRLADEMAGVADALHLAHEEGIVHRDVKPTNLLVSADGTLRLVDFGLARLAGEGASMTVTGQILGTPHYMSPEQAMARQVPIDHRTDIYSLGATLYEALTLRTPFTGDSLPAVCSAILHQEPASPRKTEPRIPRDLETIVLKAMEKDRDRRYQTAGELASDLRRFAAGMPIAARRIGPLGKAWRKVKRNKLRAALVAAVVLLAAAGGLLALRSARESERLRNAEYERLLAEGEDLMARSMSMVLESEFGETMHPGKSARDVLARAIELVPERAEAWWLRALAPGRTLEQRLSDVDAAGGRGLPNGTCHRLRALFLGLSERTGEAEDERKLAALDPDDSPAARYAGARIRALSGDRHGAREMLTRLIEDPETGEAIRFLALTCRAHLLMAAQDWSGALDDLHGVKNLGDESVPTRFNIALAWRRLGKQDVADGVFVEALRQTKAAGTASAWVALCDAFGRQSGPEAVPWLDRATREGLEAHPDCADLHLARGIALTSLHVPSLALVSLGRSLELGTSRVHGVHYWRARALCGLDRLDEALAALDLADEIQPDCTDCIVSRGVVQAGLEGHEAALAAFDRAVALDPTNPLFHTNRACALWNLGRFTEALAAAEHALQTHPDYDWALTQKATALMRLDREREARTIFDQVMEPAFESPEIAYWCAKAFDCLESWKKVLIAAERCLELNPPTSRRGEAMFFRAKAMSHLGRGEEALRVCEEALGIDDSLAQAHLLRGILLQNLHRRSEEALEALNRALALGGAKEEMSPALVNKGIVLAALGRLREALGAYDAALKLEPTNLSALVGKGSMLVGLGRPWEALGVLDRLVELQPENGMAWVNRGAAQGNLGSLSEAIRSFRRAEELGTAHCRLYFNWAVVLRKLNRPEDAVHRAQRSVELAPKDPRCHFLVGSILQDLRRDDGAIESLSRALVLDPSYAFARGARATSLIRRGLYAEALDDCEELVRRHPRNPQGHTLAAWIRVAAPDPELRDPAEGLELAKAAVLLNPRDASCWDILGLAHCRLEQWKAAFEAQEKSLALARDGYAAQLLPLAISCWHLGKKDVAQEAYDRAVVWIEEHGPGNVALEQLRAEAAELLDTER